MKTVNTLNAGIILLSLLLISNIVTAQVGIGTTTPVASSMLDIQSTTKGVLIPRMTTAQRAAISTPANGLLVFDTDTKSFWFYNVNTWKELVSGNSLLYADGDTKIVVEKTTDEDKIHVSTANAAGTASVERMTIDSSGKTLMGTDLSNQATTFFEIGADGTIKLGNQGASTTPDSDVTTQKNYTKITEDGSLSYVGNATRWDDLKIPVNSVKVNGADIDQPKWENFLGETALLFFEDKSVSSEQSVAFTVQMPHGWKEGSEIKPHVHWSAKIAPNAKRVYWALEYTWINVGENFPATTTIKSNSVVTPNGATLDAYEHVITPLGNIDASGKTLSSMLICKLYRNSSNASDTFDSEKAGLLEIDIHYQIDSDGSNQEYTKNN